MKGAVLACALLSAVLYSALMPLWEGFDEPFHYAYVDWLSTHSGFPVLGRTPLSAEVAESLRLAPASPVVRENLPFVMTFSEYFALPAAERTARRARLRGLSPALRGVDAPGTSNYQAQQAPLAYLLLALPNQLWGRLPLPARVMRLRLLCGVAACLLQVALTLALARRLKLPPTAGCVAVWLVVSCQVFYATVARVSNDWLAITLATAWCLCLLCFHEQPRAGTAARLGATLAAGLLTKAYFLAWAALTAALALWMLFRRQVTARTALVVLAIPLASAGPWYARNLLVAGGLTGTLQEAAGTGWRQVLQAAVHLSWPEVIAASARGALWTGNNSFATFSVATLNLMAALLTAAAFLWLWSAWRKTGRAGEWLVAAGCLCFTAVLLYSCALFFAHHGDPAVSAASWHVQAMAAPTACLLALGWSRSGHAGRWIGAAAVAMSSYLLVATYLVKLIPLYGGYPEGRMRPAPLLRWYIAGENLLGATALGSPAVIWPLTFLVVALATVVGAGLCRRLLRKPASP
ncbi:MAG: hypothetical protein FJW34_24715 [Acidobacteria bacterium]|nr:hypothetical protein [Acidobacteriota bacterium]